MKITRKTLMYVFEKVSRMPNIESLILWFRPLNNMLNTNPGDPRWATMI